MIITYTATKTISCYHENHHIIDHYENRSIEQYENHQHENHQCENDQHGKIINGNTKTTLQTSKGHCA